jgi:predicted unusual protein kinase regulating ubiquinone biosynthesis (AarF/ABC1/UbiB family)
VNSFKYLQTECNEKKNIPIDKFAEPFLDILHSWEKYPISVGSIAQIYRGKLKDGTDVVLKIKHENMEHDIQLWKRFFASPFLSKIINLLASEINVNINFDEFFVNLSKQLNFNIEVDNLKKFYNLYRKNKFIQIPRYIAHSENVIIMEYLSSLNFQDIQKDLSAEDSRYFLLLARILYQDNIFIKDVIHMDLHNGNWGINLQNRSLVLYDFGWVLYDQADFKRFFICAHLSRKKTLEFIVQRYQISDKNKDLENFVLNLTEKIDTIHAINLVLREFQEIFVMDNFMFCVLSFCVFMGSISENFEEFESYVEDELKLLRENEIFVPLRSLIIKFRDPNVRPQVEDFISCC